MYKMLNYYTNFVLSPQCAAHHGDNFMIKYLSEIETQFENTLACLSGAQMGSSHEKNLCRKSRDTLPLRMSACTRGSISQMCF